MKKSLFPIVLMVLNIATAYPSPDISSPLSLVIIYVKETPSHEDQHQAFNHQLHQLIDDMNQWLESRDDQSSWWTRLMGWMKGIRSPENQHKFFCARFDHHFCNASLYVPDTVEQAEVIERLKHLIAQKKLPFGVDCDCGVEIARNPDLGLEGYALSLDILEKLKHGGSLSSDHLPASEEEIKEALFWHHYLPTIGLRTPEPFVPPAYPFLPHYCALWELAPAKGKGVKVAVIDTGVAAFSVPHNNEFKKNYDLDMRADFNHHTYNVVSHHGLDPVEQSIREIRPYIASEKFNHAQLERLVPQWIRECLEKGESHGLRDYIHKNGKQGNQQDITIVEKFITDKFNLIDLDNKRTIEQFVPIVKINKNKSTFVAGHGSHAFGTIAGSVTYPGATTPHDDIGICGLAPAADVIMIKAFRDDGLSNKSSLISALKRAIAYKSDVVNLSLKIADKINIKDESTQLLDRLLGLVPYVIAASGNGTGDEAFPAHFETVTFDVGAFRYKKDNNQMSYPIISFSEYSKNYGPKFVAPGYNILSSGLVPNQKVDSMYTFMSGTSMSAPIMSGFVALILAEFKDHFTEDQIQKVIYKSCVKMHNDSDWQTKALLGTVDMRTCLFMLHVIRALKAKIAKKSLEYDVNQHFNNVLAATHRLIFSMPDTFSKKYLGGSNIQDNYVAYIQLADKFKVQHYDEYKKATRSLTPLFKKRTKVDAMVELITDWLICGLNHAYIPQETTYFNEQLCSEISTLLHQPNVALFGHLNQATQRRLEHKIVVDDYWKSQAKKLQEGA